MHTARMLLGWGTQKRALHPHKTHPLWKEGATSAGQSLFKMLLATELRGVPMRSQCRVVLREDSQL